MSNALIPSEDQQALRLRLVLFMPRFIIKKKFARLVTNIIIIYLWWVFEALIIGEWEAVIIDALFSINFIRLISNHLVD